MTLASVGRTQNEKHVVIKCVIDGGEFKGKKISTAYPPNSHELHEFAEGLGVMLGTFDGENWREYLAPLLKLEKEKRFSASIAVEEFETKRQRGYKYDLTFVDSPTGKPEIRLRKNATQFQR